MSARIRERLARLLGATVASRPGTPGGAPDYKAAWNEAAAHDARDAILTGATAEAFERTGREDAERIRRHLRGHDVVLNIGCGVARVERYLAPHVAELWAVDVSGEMIRQARLRLAEFSNVHLREVANDEFLRSFAPDQFDLVFSFLVLQHLTKEDAFLYMRDVLRVLKSGGVFVGQFPNYLSPEYTRGFVEGLAAVARSPGRVRPYTVEEVRHTLDTIGFTAIELSLAAGERGDAEIYFTARKG